MSDEVAAPLFGRWSDVLGHERVISALRRAVHTGKPNHAYLLLGPKGIGKMTIAAALTAALLCERGQGEACGDCPGCSKLRQSAHTGLMQVTPGGKANIIGVDPIAEVQRKLSYRRLEGDYRIVIVDNAGLMSDSAQNKLLKTLEEPPAGTVIVLCALHPGQLLQTVRSRCQKLGLGVVPSESITQWLIDAHGATPSVAQQAAIGAQGVPGTALELLDPEIGADRRERIALLGRALSGDRASISETVAMVDRDKAGCASTLTLLQELLRDAMVRGVDSAVPLAHPELELSGPLTRLTPRRLAAHALAIEDVQEKLTRNVHPGGLMGALLDELTSG